MDTPTKFAPPTLPGCSLHGWRRGGLLAVGAAIVAVLIGGLLPGSTQRAHAAETVWDRLAMCEASGNWAINTGNGYFGGVQFSITTWQEFGGTDYAERADLAGKDAQIFIATRVWRRQGWKAWPSCTRKLGITAAPPAARRPRVPVIPAAAPGGRVLNLHRTPHTVVALPSTQRTYTAFRVRRGVRYRLVMVGKYRWNRTSSRADATCSLWNGRWRVQPPGQKVAQALNVMVGPAGAQRGTWKARSGGLCDPNHVYYMDVRARHTTKLLISTNERTRSDNYGVLQLHVLPYRANISRL